MSQTPDQTGVGVAEATSTGGRLVAGDGRSLSLQGITVRADMCAGLARVRLEQQFRNPYAEPLRVTYQVPLPPDGVVSAYAFWVGARRIVGEVDRVAAARERFEQALVEGRTAALLEQDRSSLFTQEIGNIPPGAEVVAELVIDQRLRWLEEGVWEWRFPTVVAPRYLGAEGRVPDGDRITVDVADGAQAVVASLALTIRDTVADGGRVDSPSHSILASVTPSGTEVSLADDAGFALDRDMVVRWRFEHRGVGISLDTGRPGAGRHTGQAYGLLTITPPLPEERAPSVPRDLIVLMDLSGSMAGAPLDQSRRVVARLIETLADGDQLELIGFADRARRWKTGAAAATAAMKRQALRWLDRLAAGGGTEMRSGVVEALHPLRSGAQRQVVLVTDGQIGFEEEIVGLIARDLPAGCRLHTVGVGPAVNRTLTAEAARAGRGAEVVVGLDEDPGPAVERLLSRLRAPVLTDIEVSGPALLDHAPARVPDVHAAAPLLVGLRLRPEGGDLRMTGQLADTPWEASVRVPAVVPDSGNPAVVSLYGREAVQDLEMQRTAGGSGTIDEDIERIGLDFQISTRLTSWVAVSEEPTVDPRQSLRRERIPQSLPQGLSVEGLGLRGSSFPLMELRAPYGPALYGPAPSISLLASSPSPLRPPSRIRLGAGLRWPSRVVRGRIVVLARHALVVEITLEGELDWDPANPELVWVEGGQCLAEIDWDGTTRSQKLQAGQTIRLVLRVPDDDLVTEPVGVFLTCGDAPLAVRLRP